MRARAGGPKGRRKQWGKGEKAKGEGESEKAALNQAWVREKGRRKGEKGREKQGARMRKRSRKGVKRRKARREAPTGPRKKVVVLLTFQGRRERKRLVRIQPPGPERHPESSCGSREKRRKERKGREKSAAKRLEKGREKRKGAAKRHPNPPVARAKRLAKGEKTRKGKAQTVGKSGKDAKRRKAISGRPGPSLP